MRYIVTFVTLLLLAGCQDDSGTLDVGSKPFSESMVTAEMIAQLAENSGIVVERQIPYGPTQQIMEATRKGIIDVYPEYNGTSLIFLGQAPTSDGEASTETVQRLFEPLGLQMAGKLGFSNDYAIVMTAQRAEELGIKSISDLAGLDQTIKFAVEDDFLQRPADGLQQMNRRYGITDFSTEEYPIGTEGKDQIVLSLLDGSADVGELFMTDGQIAEYNLIVLEDDLQFFPVYELAPLVRTDAVNQFEGLSDVLRSLEGAVTAEDMRAMNKAVDLDAQTPAAVATAFLVEKGLLPEDAAATEVETLPVAVYPDTARDSDTARALRAIRAGFSGNNLELDNTASPLDELQNGSARIAMVGAEAFYRLDEAGPEQITTAEAFAVLGYRTGHLFGSRSSSLMSIGDMKKILVGPEGSASARVMEMVLYSLGQTDTTEILYSDQSLAERIAQLNAREVDGVFVMADQGDRTVRDAMDSRLVRLIDLDEWAEGGHTARFSFIRPATIAANTYPSQTGAIDSITTQYVLASPVLQQKGAGEVGPGTAGLAAAVPIGAEEVKLINESLKTGEVIDPAMPVHAALIPEVKVVDKSLPFSADVSIANILMILFTAWVIYLIGLPSPRDFKMPKD